MREGTFRTDLYYRLDILKLYVPPLRERAGDVLSLFDHFLRVYSSRFKKPHKKVLPAARKLLEHYLWPGNVRELMNLAERLTVIGSGETIGEEDVQAACNQGLDALPSGLGGGAYNRGQPAPAGQPKPKLDKTVLLNALQEVDYHYAKAAARLGISRTTLWRWLKECDM